MRTLNKLDLSKIGKGCLDDFIVVTISINISQLIKFLVQIIIQTITAMCRQKLSENYLLCKLFTLIVSVYLAQTKKKSYKNIERVIVLNEASKFMKE